MKKTSASTVVPKPKLPKIVSIETLRERRDQDGTAGGGRVRHDGGSDVRCRTDPPARGAPERALDLPDVRIDKVIEAKMRISRGYYDSDKIRLDILEAMLGEERGTGERPATAKTPKKRKTTGGRPSAKAERVTARTGRSDRPGTAKPARPSRSKKKP
ncbi:MAG: hypothetical protein R3E12_13945 [Candidatus Eisenbacteria bacterium]